MTKPDLTETDSALSDGAIIIRRALLAIGGGIALVFIAGMIAGYSSVMIENGGPDPVDAAVLGAMLLLAAAVVWGMRRFWPRTSDEPVAPRVKSARTILLAAVVLSVPLGIIIASADDGGSTFISNAPVNPSLALLAIGLWLVAGPLLSWLWWKRVDEHEADAYRDGALVAVHAYMFVTPAWWMATRAGWLPAQDPMLVLLAVSVIWSIVWFIRRYL